MMIKPSYLETRFFESYELGELIDKGGNGQVYKFIRKHDNSTFALKCLPEKIKVHGQKNTKKDLRRDRDTEEF